MNDKINVSKVLTDEVTIIDGTTNDIISNVEVGDGPFALEYNSENMLFMWQIEIQIPFPYCI